jgi:hypothetical protein
VKRRKLFSEDSVNILILWQWINQPFRKQCNKQNIVKIPMSKKQLWNRNPFFVSFFPETNLPNSFKVADAEEDRSPSYPANPSNLVDRLSSPDTTHVTDVTQLTHTTDTTDTMHTLFTGNTDAYWPRAVAAAAAGPYASGLPANLTNCYSAAYDQVTYLFQSWYGGRRIM